MIVVMRTGASAEQIDEIKRTIEEHGLEAYVSRGEERTVIGVVGQGVERVEHIKQMPGVEQVIRVSKPYKLASREHHPDRTRVRVGDIDVGAGNPLRMMAGPCAVESHEQLLATARWVKREGAVALRGGAFKPRTSPYAFQGLGDRGPEAARADARGDRPAGRVGDHRPGRRRGLRPATSTCSRSAAATCTTSCCSRRPASHASRCCSSAASGPRSRSG